MAYIIQEKTLNDIGDAIREKTGRNYKISPTQMPIEIGSILSNNISSITITSNGVYVADDGANGYSPITVNVPLDYTDALKSYFREIYTFDNGGRNLDWADTGSVLGNEWRDWVANTFHINGYIYRYANPVRSATLFCYNNTSIDGATTILLKIYNGVPSFESFFEGCTNFKGYFNFSIYCPDIGDYGGLTYDKLNSFFVGNAPSLENMFKGCHNLQRFPKSKPVYDQSTPYEDYYPDPFYIFRNSGVSSLEGIFYDCYSLRQMPAFGWYEWYGANHMTWDSPGRFLRNGGYNEAFKNCYALDYIRDLPVSEGVLTNKDKQIFTDMVSHCFRLNALTFKCQDDGTPYTANWTSQCLDLSDHVGYGTYPLVYKDLITSYNSGITSSFKVKDDETYKDLKNSEHWYTYNAAYSRYNKISAAETIHSLPDTSAAVNKDTINIIKFAGIAGELTDGGAINTLSDEDIAVAAAKGWTVAYV